MTFEEYLTAHGITKEQAQKFGLKQTKDQRYGAQLAIPIKDQSSTVLFHKYRSLEREGKEKDIPKYTFDPGTHETTFNAIALQKPALVIFEGELDTIRADQEGIPGISGTNGANSIPDEWEELLKGKELYICYDNDEAGKRGTYKLIEKFPKAKVITLPEGVKDTSEFFLKYKKQDFIDLLKIAKLGEEWAAENPKEDYSTLTGAQLLLKEFPKDEWIVEKFLPTSGFTFISGESGTGKSFISLALAKSALTGEDFLTKYKAIKVPVLIIDKENGLKRLQNRIKGLGFKIEDLRNFHLLQYPEKFSLENTEFLQALQIFIEVKQIKLIILDSFIDILVGEENKSTDVSAVINKLRELAPQSCWLVLHHESKPIPRFQRSAGQRMRGSGNILAQIDYQFATTVLADGKTIHIEQGKARDLEKMKKFSIKFQSGENNEMTGFEYIGDVSEQTSRVEEMKNLIVSTLQVVENYQLPQKELLDRLMGQASERTLRDAIKVLELEGTIKRVPVEGGYKNQKALELVNYRPDENDETTGFVENIENDVEAN